MLARHFCQRKFLDGAMHSVSEWGADVQVRHVEARADLPTMVSATLSHVGLFGYNC